MKKLKRLLPELVDVEEWLDSINIEFHHPGSKNTGRESISISCPFCGDHEYSGDNHLGIRLDNKLWSCWICPEKGGLIKLAMKLMDCSYLDAVTSLTSHMNIDPSLYQDVNSRPQIRARTVDLIGDDVLLTAHRNYLISRGFDPDYIFNKHSLRCVGAIGRYRHCLIVPYFRNGRVVTFSAADITGTSETKYKYLSDEESIYPMGQVLYNIDEALDTVVVMEGITDVWRWGDGAVALGRKKATAWQIKRLAKFRRVFIMLDSDAGDMAEQLAQDLGLFTETVLCELSEGDPGDLTEKEVRHFKKEMI